jgi:hypothetical protein
MKITKVTYDRLFPAGSYLNERIGFEAEIDGKDDPLAAIEQLRVLAEENHKAKYPHFYQDGMAIPQEQKQEDEPPGFSLEHEIKNAKDLTLLESFHFLAKNQKDAVIKRELLMLYDKRKKELSK